MYYCLDFRLDHIIFVTCGGQNAACGGGMTKNNFYNRPHFMWNIFDESSMIFKVEQYIGFSAKG